MSKEIIKEKLARPIIYTSKRYYIAITIVMIPILLAIFAYSIQLILGLGVTGLSTTIFWGMYISSFVFFIGISHAGTLISAILRITKAEWRKPITRMAEAITVFALILAVAQVIIFDLGRPDRILHAIIFGRLQSPMVWDLFSITTYFIGSAVFLYTAMVPDFALFLNYEKLPRWKARMYRVFSLNWRGTEEQYERLSKAIKVMAASIIPIMVTVHTVVSWVFAMSIKPGWHSTVFGPYFVTGAIYSGIGAVIIVAWLYRKIFQSEEYIKYEHFAYLGWLLFSLDLALIYMTANHIVTDYYGGKVEDVALINSLMFGEWAPIFWFYIIINIVIPLIILPIVLLYKKSWVINGTFLASILVNVGMYIERYYIVASTLSITLLPYPIARYTPTWVELSILIGSLSLFVLFYLIFIKIFPPISVWEVEELDTIKSSNIGFNPYKASRVTPLASSIPIWLLMVVISAYFVLLYIISRAMISPVNTQEGFIAFNQAFVIGIGSLVTIALTCGWIAIGYTIYQLYKISKV
ncbi:MAG: NrfD/PsrC family molybdoenzyme membrane anchor subunit [Nitrososphaerota archaeon]|nr:polysulfide reductase NrfD [Nitrososphaerales archaeon]MDW8045389.1 NrfD/PsrC family molybdoenzyme membrane anchor subunit [Nitrososphaerota archaeon]